MKELLFLLFSISLLCVSCAAVDKPARISKPAQGRAGALPEIGFSDLGIAAPMSCSRGQVVAKDGKGRGVVLVWLSDCRGAYAILSIDADTGKSAQRPVPFPTDGDAPFCSMLSEGNKYYAHFGSHFCEYDPVAQDFTFWTNTAPATSFSIIEDGRGIVWSATYPQSGLVSFDPETRSFKDYGQLYKQNWAQYPSGLSMDDAGWVYWGVGSAMCQVMAFDPKTGIVKALVPEEKRHPGGANVFRAENGRVYASAGRKDGWIECRAGAARKIEGAPPERKDSGANKHTLFPDGRRLGGVDLVDSVLLLDGPTTGEVRRVSFKYTSEGAPIMGVAAAPDGTICGGTTFPARFFSYDPKTGRMINRPTLGQWNAMAGQGKVFYAGAYTGGFMLEWNTARPWVDPKRGDTNSNPLFLGENREVMNRPHKLLPLPDGKTIVMGGTAGYGANGGGLVFWDNQARTKTRIKHTEIIPEHSTLSMVALPGGKILGGSTVRPGTGGEKKASIAELYIMDVATKRVEWRKAVLPDAHEYTDMCPGPNGLVFGLADGPDTDATDRLRNEDGRRFFVFDPARKAIIHVENTEPEFGPISYQQGYRKLLAGPDGRVFILFSKCIAEVDPGSFKISLLAKSPANIDAGGDILDGVIYFASASRLYGYKIPGRPAAGRKSP